MSERVMTRTSQKPMHYRLLNIYVLSLLLMVESALCIADSVNEPKLPLHKITYAASFKNIPIGSITLQLSYDATTHRYHYETIADPVWLARVVVSQSTHEDSFFSLNADGVKALDYALLDPKQPNLGTTYHYDWEHLKVSGYHNGQALTVSITNPTYDPLSIRAQLLFDFSRGKAEMSYSMLDGNELKRFVYAQKGTESISTDFGVFKTVAWDSTKEHASETDRAWRYWLAPELGYLPLLIEQRQDGKSRLRFSAKYLEWTDPKTLKTQALGKVTPR